jgi:catechol 2,3-dioxygenase-like lactoylglutathione lyase family enzyme
MIIDHVTFHIADLAASKAFYDKAFAPLGITQIMEFQGIVGYGKNAKPEFWFAQSVHPQTPMHFAFLAATREQVDEFYRAAIAAGGKDNGPPGLREHYHPNYYGAFVLDPDGHNVEAVCHG